MHDGGADKAEEHAIILSPWRNVTRGEDVAT
jgi:hypothetical protein